MADAKSDDAREATVRGQQQPKPADDPKPAPKPDSHGDDPKPEPKAKQKRQGDLPGNSDPRERHQEPSADEDYGD